MLAFVLLLSGYVTLSKSFLPSQRTAFHILSNEDIHYVLAVHPEKSFLLFVVGGRERGVRMKTA